MRLASIQRDYWQLLSAEESHRKSPETFLIPPLDQRKTLKRGQAAKLMFHIESNDAQGRIMHVTERMWVILSERIGDFYIGILDNEPVSVEPTAPGYLRNGAEIPFLAEHIIEIQSPPRDYVAKRLSEPPENYWPGD